MMIDGASCNVNSVSNSELECETGPHAGSMNAKVEVEVGGNGIAEEVSNVLKQNRTELNVNMRKRARM